MASYANPAPARGLGMCRMSALGHEKADGDIEGTGEPGGLGLTWRAEEAAIGVPSPSGFGVCDARCAEPQPLKRTIDRTTPNAFITV
jgi:hypothetical protein